MDVGIDAKLPLVHLSVIDDDGKDDDGVEEKQDNDDDDNEEDDDDDNAAGTALMLHISRSSTDCTTHPPPSHPTLHSPLRGGSDIPHQQLPLAVVVGAADTEAVGSGCVGRLTCSAEHEPLA